MKANRQGRIGEGVPNLFSGLLRDARDGTPLTIGWRRGERILRRDTKSAAKGSTATFPYDVFEQFVLFRLNVKLSHSLEEMIDAIYSAERSDAVWEARKEDGFYEILAAEKMKAAENTKAARLQLRAALQEMLSVVQVLVVQRVRYWKHCVAVQLCLKDNRRVNCLIVCSPNRERDTNGERTLMFPIEDLWPKAADQLDLGNQEDAALLECILRKCDLKPSRAS